MGLTQPINPKLSICDGQRFSVYGCGFLNIEDSNQNLGRKKMIVLLPPMSVKLRTVQHRMRMFHHECIPTPTSSRVMPSTQTPY
jgi:hypothetical protein